MAETQPGLPHPELVEDVAPLAAEEALTSIPEEQSPTLKIEVVSSDLARSGEFRGSRG